MLDCLWTPTRTCPQFPRGRLQTENIYKFHGMIYCVYINPDMPLEKRNNVEKYALSYLANKE